MNQLNSGIDILLIGIDHIQNGVKQTKILPSLYIDNLNTGEAVLKTNHLHLCPHKKSIAERGLFDCKKKPRLINLKGKKYALTKRKRTLMISNKVNLIRKLQTRRKKMKT